MTPHQSLALAHPCYLAGQTVHPRFGYRVCTIKAVVDGVRVQRMGETP